MTRINCRNLFESRLLEKILLSKKTGVIPSNFATENLLPYANLKAIVTWKQIPLPVKLSADT